MHVFRHNHHFEGLAVDYKFVFSGFMAQGGDFTHSSGIGGESIYGNKFPGALTHITVVS